MEIILRKSTETDLEIFFLNQTDEEANYMAAFTPKDPFDRPAYISKWKRLLQDKTINMQTIFIGDEAIGCVVKFEIEGEAEITYAINKAQWGNGITTIAVQ